MEIILAILFIYILYKIFKKKKKDILVQNISSEKYPNHTPIEIIEAYEGAQYDQLRFLLQKIAYKMVGDRHTQKEKDDFKAIMTYFASRDPLYAKIIKKITVIIAKNEGIIQSKIYQFLSDYDVETIRYVLYFAHELGDIRRVKQGRSYELFTPIYNKNKTLENKTILYNKNNIKITTEVSLGTGVIDQEAYDKYKLVTKLKEEGKLKEACQILYEVKGDCHIDTRLSLFLQQAGEFEKAIIEFKEALNNSPKYYQVNFSHQDSKTQNGLMLHNYSTIFDKARLVYQREKKYKEILYFGTMSTILKFLAMKIQNRLNEYTLDLFYEDLKYDIEKLIKKSKLVNEVSVDEILQIIKKRNLDLINIITINEELSNKINCDSWKISFI